MSIKTPMYYCDELMFFFFIFLILQNNINIFALISYVLHKFAVLINVQMYVHEQRFFPSLSPIWARKLGSVLNLTIILCNIGEKIKRNHNFELFININYISFLSYCLVIYFGGKNIKRRIWTATTTPPPKPQGMWIAHNNWNLKVLTHHCPWEDDPDSCLSIISFVVYHLLFTVYSLKKISFWLVKTCQKVNRYDR